MQKVIEIIDYENESHKVDFKRIEYDLGKNTKKNEILKDFSAFANHLSDDEKYIIIGIKENQDRTKEIFGIENPTDEAKYRQFITENIEPQINFEYNSFTYKNQTICFFKLADNYNRPYLFKKDLKNPINDKTEYRYGDGFIRIGTSTKKIGRKELDDITESRKKYKNRQMDIDIFPLTGKSSEPVISSKMDVNYLDLKIINKSNKSIDLDIEMVIKKSAEYKILLEEELLRAVYKIESSQKKSNYLSPTTSSYNFVLSNLYVNAEENEDEFIVHLNPIKSKFAVTLRQNSVLENVFQKSILVLEKIPNLIEAQVIIRCDDFTNGALIKNISFLR